MLSPSQVYQWLLWFLHWVRLHEVSWVSETSSFGQTTPPSEIDLEELELKKVYWIELSWIELKKSFEVITFIVWKSVYLDCLGWWDLVILVYWDIIDTCQVNAQIYMNSLVVVTLHVKALFHYLSHMHIFNYYLALGWPFFKAKCPRVYIRNRPWLHIQPIQNGLYFILKRPLGQDLKLEFGTVKNKLPWDFGSIQINLFSNWTESNMAIQY